VFSEIVLKFPWFWHGWPPDVEYEITITAWNDDFEEYETEVTFTFVAVPVGTRHVIDFEDLADSNYLGLSNSWPNNLAWNGESAFVYPDFLYDELGFTDADQYGTGISQFFVDGVGFTNKMTYDWGYYSWYGFGLSTETNTTYLGMENEMASITGTGANGSLGYGIAFWTDGEFDWSTYEMVSSLVLQLPEGALIDSMMITNTVWSALILPFMEQTAVYDMFDTKLWIDHPDNAKAVQSVVPTYICPSYGGKGQSAGSMTRTETHPASTVPATFRCARSDYGGIVTSRHVTDGGNIDSNGILIIMQGSDTNPVALADVMDGTSNTLMVSEDSDHPDGAWASIRNLWEHRLDLHPLNKRENRGLIIANGFQCYHPGGVFGQFGDGSVRFLSNNIDPDVLGSLVNRKAGNVLRSP